MDHKTVQRLNDINRKFYEVTAAAFDETRGSSWPGWEKVLAYLPDEPAAQPFGVLDVGCGNGRFGVFLGANYPFEIDYHGLDNNRALLDRAYAALRDVGGMTVTLGLQDVVIEPPRIGLFDLVVAFGVIHHIPGAEQRREFVRVLAESVRPGGLLVLACWRFYDYERFRERIAPWPDDLAEVVERHDYLLDWRRGEVAYRYCHYVDDAEQQALIAASGLVEVVGYRADGFSGAVNRYSVLWRSV